MPTTSSPDGMFKLFVCHIPKVMTIEELRAIFSPYGNVAECNVVKDKVTNEGKGFGFVGFRLLTEAQGAILSLHEKRTFPGNDKPVIVRFKDDKPAPGTAPAAMGMPQMFMPQMFNPYQPAAAYPQQQIPQQQMQPDPYAGYAGYPGHAAAQAYPVYPTQFQDPNALAMAQWQQAAGGAVPGMQAMMPQMTTGFVAPSVGAPTPKQQQVEGPPGSNLFVCYLPPEMADEQLRAVFQQFGTLLTCQIHRDAQGQSKAYGWVNYDNPSSAAMALQNLNGMQIGNKRIKIQISSKERAAGAGAVKPY